MLLSCSVLLCYLSFTTTASSVVPPARPLKVLLVELPLSGHTAVPISLGQELVRRGHEVTLFTAQLRDSDRIKTHAEKAGIRFWGGETNSSFDDVEDVAERSSSESFIDQMRANANLASLLLEVGRVMYTNLDNRRLKEWDVLIMEEGNGKLALCLGHRWGLPVVMLGSSLPLVPHLHPPWPFPSALSGMLSDNLGFGGRLLATVQAVATWAAVAASLELLTYKHPDCSGVTLNDVMRSPGVRFPLLVPTSIGFEFPRPASPLTTYTGPILPSVTDPIPEDVEQWMAAWPVGSVVYISMGSVVYLTKQQARAIIEGLEATGYGAVWSLKKKNRYILEGLKFSSQNVLLLDWAPQLSVLRHRSIGMAILHGGMNGIHEALDSGVPVIVLPSYGDQFANAARVVHNGLGLHLSIKSLTGSVLTESIRTIESGGYRDRVQKLQKIFRHAGGVSKAADLVEFYVDVGYNHLIPAYAKYNWSWVQYYNADVYGLLLTFAALMAWVNVCICKCACKKCRKNVNKEKHKKEE